jgi:hypothetical protein
MLTVQTGAGDDNVHFRVNCRFDGGFSLDLGQGSNYLNIPSLTVTGIATITSGGDSDNLDLGWRGEPEGHNIQVNGSISINLGNGADRLYASINGDADIKINLGFGDDMATFQAFDVTSLSLDGNDGFDTLEKRGVNAFGESVITSIEKVE